MTAPLGCLSRRSVKLALEPRPRYVRVGHQLRGRQQAGRAFRVLGDPGAASAAAPTAGRVLRDPVRNGQGLVIEAP
jgi:hypothetical protein